MRESNATDRRKRSAMRSWNTPLEKDDHFAANRRARPQLTIRQLFIIKRELKGPYAIHNDWRPLSTMVS